MSTKTEILRRRTFAIISHPDAGKTTITEKILYVGGAIKVAGEVRGKAGTKAATSDWMKLEQERGISITSSSMNFDYKGLRINLLDTPGHKDFGEDTYRTLIAADCAAMLIDAAKGVEAQTRKLYEVCRLRKMPIFTFANKVDREGKDPLDLIDDVENTLKMKCYPVTWPIGMGHGFKGLFNRLTGEVDFYQKEKEEPEVVKFSSRQDEGLKTRIGEKLFLQLNQELDLLDGIVGEFNRDEFLAGELSPMTFGSAKYVWGIETFLNLFCDYAPAPQPRPSKQGIVEPLQEDFTGFVFKIQANMDKKHRDRVAFMRVCSGKFERGMKIKHMRLNRELRLSYASQLMAKERETVEIAYAGDIVGLNDTGNFQIGDSVTTGKDVIFTGIPRFSPEHFGRVTISDALSKKKLEKGIRQLVEEGSVQLFYDPKVGWQDPILGVVGMLQFEVLLYRLKDEYGVEAKLDKLNYTLARWLQTKDGKPTRQIVTRNQIFNDLNDQPVLLFEREWDLNWLQKDNPDIVFKINSSLNSSTDT
jgi:peptide chain release factor 3